MNFSINENRNTSNRRDVSYWCDDDVNVIRGQRWRRCEPVSAACPGPGPRESSLTVPRPETSCSGGTTKRSQGEPRDPSEEAFLTLVSVISVFHSLQFMATGEEAQTWCLGADQVVTLSSKARNKKEKTTNKGRKALRWRQSFLSHSHCCTVMRRKLLLNSPHSMKDLLQLLWDHIHYWACETQGG